MRLNTSKYSNYYYFFPTHGQIRIQKEVLGQSETLLATFGR
jgi:hypothetical protein